MSATTRTRTVIVSTRRVVLAIVLTSMLAVVTIDARAEIVTWEFDAYFDADFRNSPSGVPFDGTVVESTDPTVATHLTGRVTMDTVAPKILSSRASFSHYGFQADPAAPTHGTIQIIDNGSFFSGMQPFDELTLAMDVPVQAPTAPLIWGPGNDTANVTFHLDFYSSDPSMLNGPDLPADPPQGYDEAHSEIDFNPTTSGPFNSQWAYLQLDDIHRSANPAPVVGAGVAQSVFVRDSCTLAGSVSDPDNTAITYSWTLAAPDGTSAEMTDGDTLHPSFVAMQLGTYIATLSATNAYGESRSASSTITSVSRVPSMLVNLASLLNDLRPTPISGDMTSLPYGANVQHRQELVNSIEAAESSFTAAGYQRVLADLADVRKRADSKPVLGIDDWVKGQAAGQVRSSTDAVVEEMTAEGL